MFKTFIAAARDLREEHRNETDPVLKAAGYVIFGLVIAVILGVGLAIYAGVTEEDSFHCGEGERIVVKFEEVRFSKHNYGRAEVARCVSPTEYGQN